MSKQSHSHLQLHLLANYTPYSAKDFTTLDRDWSKFPGLHYTFTFEELLLDRLHGMRQYVRQHPLLPLLLSTLYCLAIRQLQSWMSHRAAFRLRRPLILWNIALACFSLFGCFRIFPEIIWTLQFRGLFASTCDHRYIDDSRIFLWNFLFAFSKILEFGDTAFLLLRKQPLLTLHWIHHATTLLYCWYSLDGLPAHSRWLCGMNFAVHSLMYSYYALRAGGWKVANACAQLLTGLQIVQMTAGGAMQLQALWLGEAACDVPVRVAASGFAMYALFWGLFVQLFWNKYLKETGNEDRGIKKRD